MLFKWLLARSQKKVVLNMQFFFSISQQPLGTSVAQQIARAAGARAAPPPSMRVKPDFHAYWIMKIVFKLMFEKKQKSSLIEN